MHISAVQFEVGWVHLQTQAEPYWWAGSVPDPEKCAGTLHSNPDQNWQTVGAQTNRSQKGSVAKRKLFAGFFSIK